jgi:hypothetical protein
MKNIVIFCLLLVSNLNLFSQSDKDEILQTFSEYSSHVENKDNTKLVEYLHPGMFEVAPKEMLIEMMDNAFADKTISMTFGEMRIDSLSDIMVENTNKYCLIYHNFDLTMKMLPTNDSEEAMKVARETAFFTYEYMQNAYGEENVKFDKETVSFEILMASQTFAINDEKTDGWKFIEAKKDSHIILKNILPESVFTVVN